MIDELLFKRIDTKYTSKQNLQRQCDEEQFMNEKINNLKIEKKNLQVKLISSLLIS